MTGPDPASYELTAAEVAARAEYLRQDYTLDPGVADKLLSLPKFRAAVADPRQAPRMPVQCPRHHHLLTVELAADRFLHPHIWPALEPDSAPVPGTTYRSPVDGLDVLADGWADAHRREGDARGILGDRAILDCPRCSYVGTVTQPEWVRLYAVAVELGRAAIRLSA